MGSLFFLRVKTFFVNKVERLFSMFLLSLFLVSGDCNTISPSIVSTFDKLTFTADGITYDFDFQEDPPKLKIIANGNIVGDQPLSINGNSVSIGSGLGAYKVTYKFAEADDGINAVTSVIDLPEGVPSPKLIAFTALRKADDKGSIEGDINTDDNTITPVNGKFSLSILAADKKSRTVYEITLNAKDVPISDVSTLDQLTFLAVGEKSPSYDFNFAGQGTLKIQSTEGEASEAVSLLDAKDTEIRVGKDTYKLTHTMENNTVFFRIDLPEGHPRPVVVAPTVLTTTNEGATASSQVSSRIGVAEDGTFSVTVIAEDKISKTTYQISFHEVEIVGVMLKKLVLEGGDMGDVDVVQTNFQFVVPRASDLPSQVTIKEIELDDASSSLMDNQGVTLSDGSSVDVDENGTVNLTVTSLNGKTKEYSLKVTLAAVAGAVLSSINVSYTEEGDSETISLLGENNNIVLKKGQVLGTTVWILDYSLDTESAGASVYLDSDFSTLLGDDPVRLDDNNGLSLYVKPEGGGDASHYRITFQEDLYDGSALTYVDIGYSIGENTKKNTVLFANDNMGSIELPEGELLSDVSEVVTVTIGLNPQSQKASVKVGDKDISLTGQTSNVPVTVDETDGSKKIIFSVKPQKSDEASSTYTINFVEGRLNTGSVLASISVGYGETEREVLSFAGSETSGVIVIPRGGTIPTSVTVRGVVFASGSDKATVKVGTQDISTIEETENVPASSMDDGTSTVTLTVTSQDESSQQAYSIIFQEEKNAGTVLNWVNVNYRDGTTDDVEQIMLGNDHKKSIDLPGNVVLNRDMVYVLGYQLNTESEGATVSLVEDGDPLPMMTDVTEDHSTRKAELGDGNTLSLYVKSEDGMQESIYMISFNELIEKPIVESYSYRNSQYAPVAEIKSDPVAGNIGDNIIIGLGITDATIAFTSRMQMKSSDSVMIKVSMLKPMRAYQFRVVRGGEDKIIRQGVIESNSQGEALFTARYFRPDMNIMRSFDLLDDDRVMLYQATEHGEGLLGQIGIYKPFQIRDWRDLQALNSVQQDDNTYMLMEGIDIPDEGENGLSSQGFVPIQSFSGTLDGNEMEIVDLYINIPDGDSVGIFKTLLGTVRDLRVRVSSVTGRDDVGVIAGQVLEGATIQEVTVFTTGSSFVTGRDRVGSIAGINDGTVQHVISDVDVRGWSVVGGLIGLVRPSGMVYNCYATGAVTINEMATVTTGPEDATDFGGLVGLNSGKISYSFAKGRVAGSFVVGGLVGSNYRSDQGVTSENAASISNCYATGSVTGSRSLGGLVGYNAWMTELNSQRYGQIMNCYALGEVSQNAGANVAVDGTINWFVGDLAVTDGVVISTSVVINSFYLSQESSSSAATILSLQDPSNAKIVKSEELARAVFVFTDSDWNFTNDWLWEEGLWPLLRYKGLDDIRGNKHTIDQR